MTSRRIRKYDNLIGHKCGKLTVIAHAPKTKNHSGYTYLCKCSCGNTKYITGEKVASYKTCGYCTSILTKYHEGDIVRGMKILNRDSNIWLVQDITTGKLYKKSQSAVVSGFITDEKKRPYSFKGLYANTRRKAKFRNFKFELDYDKFILLSKSNCHYCNSSPASHYKSVTYNGIDRIDNSKGYLLDNIVSCCWICNRAKGTLSVTQFMEWAKKLIKNQEIIS